ncbi:MAG: RadC family protein [Akkermansiaceae bacterium]|jgi:DNA repair protein RadC
MNAINDGSYQNISADQHPREKLSQYGASALNNAELISLLISPGIKNQSSVDIAKVLLKKYGSLGSIGSVPSSTLAEEHGIGPAKAATMAAVYELGSRVARENINSTTLDRPDVIYQHFAPQLQHLEQEQVIVVTLDTRLKHKSTNVVSIGTVNEVNAHPREILRPVITRSAYAFILIHNHPSGDPSPSRADISVTRRISEAAAIMQIDFIDHLIIGRPELGREPYYSFRESGQIP